MERNGRLEELDRRAQEIRIFILDVCYDMDLPIGPLLDAYGNAVAELVQEEHRSCRMKIAKRLAASWEAIKSR